MDDDEAQARSGGDTGGAAGAGCGGRNPAAVSNGAESATAARGRTKAEVITEALMEQVVERGNMWAAYERVLRNKGAPGADGMRVTDLKAWLQTHWPSVRTALLAGSYLPREVRAVDIPKPQFGVRFRILQWQGHARAGMMLAHGACARSGFGGPQRSACRCRSAVRANAAAAACAAAGA